MPMERCDDCDGGSFEHHRSTWRDHCPLKSVTGGVGGGGTGAGGWGLGGRVGAGVGDVVGAWGL